MPMEEMPDVEEIPGVDAPPTQRQVKGFERWMTVASRKHAETKETGNDAAKAAADAVAHLFERRKFGDQS